MAQIEVRKVNDKNDRSLPIFTEFESVADQIRTLAWNLFAHRGTGDGHALDDWLAAEREVCWPAAELTELDDEFQLKVALAGFEPEEVDVTATPGEIMIKATHRHEDSGGEESEVRWSQFERNEVFRRIELPGTVNVEGIAAKLRNGILKISAPKLHSHDEEELEKLEYSTPS